MGKSKRQDEIGFLCDNIVKKLVYRENLLIFASRKKNNINL